MSGSSSDAADEWRRTIAVLQESPISRRNVNEALTSIGALRTELERVEHRLIALARESGASWQEIAASLGMRSRQAAEQRFLRLEANAEADLGAVRKRLAVRRELDARAGVNAAGLRSALGGLIDELDRSTRRAVGREAVILLALATVRIAVDSGAGPMCDLAALAVADLSGLPPEQRSSELDAALDAVRSALQPILGTIESS